MHQLIKPADSCRRLGHRIDSRPKQPGPGEYEFCAVCSLGYEMAMSRFGHLPEDQATERADEFVRDLRRHA